MSDLFRAESMATDAKPQQRWQKKGVGYTSRDNTSPNPTKPRFGEPTKFLPIAFVLCIIMILWSIYVYCHVCPLMAHHETYTQGWTCLVIFNFVTALLLACYYRCILQHPGTIPDISSTEEGDVVWEYAPVDGREAQLGTPALETTLQEQKERKRLGDRRNCKWCNKYKPDRCHHCRVCRMCILKMDHHCPWIYNCVGFKNFKYFFLLVMYSTMATHIMTWTMWGTVQKVIHDSRSHFMMLFLTLFGNTLAGIMALMLSAFFAFHVHLMARAMTTIEFCEKSRRPNFDNNVYSRGLFGNIQAALGENPLLWFLPICPPSGNGMNFTTNRDENDLLLGRDKDIDAYREPSRGRIPSFAGTPSRSSRPARRSEAGTGGPPDDSGSDLAGDSSSGSPGNFVVRGGVVRGQ